MTETMKIDANKNNCQDAVTIKKGLIQILILSCNGGLYVGHVVLLYGKHQTSAPWLQNFDSKANNIKHDTPKKCHLPFLAFYM